ncbi:uncharacterized protein [Parasteatoda tepidariorum]|uniref:uncharacterized protein n=1 Tax=Parasteatoda tepidariorum TaxID=114398 RepID=UPI0039BCE306
MDGSKSPLRSPARSPALSPARSPALSPNRSPNKSPNISPGRTPSRASSYGSPPHARHRSASIPVTPEALKGVRNRFLNAPGGLCPLGENNRDNSNNLLSVETDSRNRLPRSAPELTVDEASPGSISPWNDDPSEYATSLACTVHRPQAEVLSRRFSETLTVSNDHSYRRRRRKSLSPHHSRSLSFRALKKGGLNTWDDFRPRGNSVPFADPLPPKGRRASHQYVRRDRSVSPRPSLPLEVDDDKYYMLRQFCITSKGDVVNKGDLYRERSRSNNSVASSGSNVTGGTGCASTATSCSSEPHSTLPPKKVLMMGTVGVGKTSLVTQFMSSEYMNYDGSLEEDTEKNISVLLDGEEHEISFADPPTMPDTPCEEQLEGDAYIVVYSITDRNSFEKAIDILFKLRDRGCTINKAVILVGNKSDLVRTRAITVDEAKSIACSYECKFIETSAAINHQVDELLVGVVTQIRLKAQQLSEMTSFTENSGASRPSRSLQKRMSLGGSGRKTRSILSKLLGKGKIKSQSCGNLYVL